MGLKLNIGASPIWEEKGWHTLDHKLEQNSEFGIAGNATNINLPNDSCDVVFCSHMFEHIPHINLPLVISEVSRVLKVGGIFRILTPDLEKITRAYVEKDHTFFNDAKLEDESLRTDLGFGGMMMNFIVSPGQDTALLDRGLSEFIAGYAHLYSYDYEMLSIMLKKLGFTSRKAAFNDSQIEEMKIPLHVNGLEKKWQNFNQDFYKKNNLVHKLVEGRYIINFKVSGFDRDPLTSLIIEATKNSFVDKKTADLIFNKSNENYNKYSYSLLKNLNFRSKLEDLKINFSSDY